MRRSNTLMGCFLLLLAFLAAAWETGEISGRFVSAAEQKHNIFESRGLLRRAKSVSTQEAVEAPIEEAPDVVTTITAQVERTQEICQDKVGLKKRLRKTRQKIPICDWVKQKKKKLCNRTIKKRKKLINLREYCGCTCLGVPTKAPKPTQPPTEPPSPSPEEDDKEQTLITCPKFEDYESPEIDLNGTECVADQICGYRHHVTGCTPSEYMCIPIVECFCNWGTFMCTIMKFESCPPPPTRPPPPGWEDPPSNWGERCDPEDPAPLIVT